MYQLSIGKMTIPYTIRYSNRKSIGMEITYEGELIVRAPRKVEVGQIEEVLLTKKEWILYHIEHCQQRKRVKEDDELLFLGERLRIEVIEQPLKVIGIRKEENTLQIRIPSGYSVDLHKLVEEWLRKQAASMLEEQVEYYSKKMNVTYNRITIKDQKTRWGSCSSKGNLNFNYRLIMAPMKVIQYVVVHELAHRVHMNHSGEFWGLVGKIMPEYEPYRKWLQEYGSQLIF